MPTWPPVWRQALVNCCKMNPGHLPGLLCGDRCWYTAVSVPRVRPSCCVPTWSLNETDGGTTRCVPTWLTQIYYMYRPGLGRGCNSLGVYLACCRERRLFTALKCTLDTASCCVPTWPLLRDRRWSNLLCAYLPSCVETGVG